MKKIICILLTLLLPCVCACNPKRQKNVTLPQKIVYLTFDDGPSANTPTILKILATHNVTATFFVVGDNVKKHPEILTEIYNLGHSVGIHSFSHKYKEIYASQLALAEDIELCKQEIKKVIPAFNGAIYRFPGGSFGLREEFLTLVKSLGYSYYDWNASTLDAEGNFTPYEILKNVIKTSGDKNKVILLCHDQKSATTLALNDIILYYINKGYAFMGL